MATVQDSLANTRSLWRQLMPKAGLSGNFVGRAVQHPNVTHTTLTEHAHHPRCCVPYTIRSEQATTAVNAHTTLHTSAERPLWNHLLVIELSPNNSPDLAVSWVKGPLIVHCTLQVICGRVSVGISNHGAQDYISDEIHCSANEKQQLIELEILEPQDTLSFIVRNTDLEGAWSSSEFLLSNLEIYRARPLEHRPFDINSKKHIPVSWLKYFIDPSNCTSRSVQNQEEPGVQKLSAAETGKLLGFSGGAPNINDVTPFRQWTMQNNDAPILAYIYTAFHPQRHLEFGTWEGFGTSLCAKQCDAQIWTINLPEGEASSSGSPVYARGDQASDSGTCIGRLYKEAGFEHRVTQILCDSAQWDSSTFPDGFFDSVLIDGGHTSPVVCNDTYLAVRLLRSGGLCLWHDFCPDPNIIRSFDSVRGVVHAISHHFEEWSLYFSQLIWIEPSFLLLGVRNSKRYLIDKKVQ